jgi:hypothetical protein
LSQSIHSTSLASRRCRTLIDRESQRKADAGGFVVCSPLPLLGRFRLVLIQFELDEIKRDRIMVQEMA